MRANRLAVSVLMLMAAPEAAPARAATTHSITVSSDSFTPAARTIPRGDTILWVWSQGPHNVTAFSGASYASGDRLANATYTQMFGGGVVKYRCTLHSTLIGGDCEGMCGRIDEKPVDDTEPEITIDRPGSGQTLTPTPRLQGGVVNPVAVEGQASDDIGVLAILFRLYDTTGRAQDQVATCIGCPDASVQWKLDLNLLPGSYVAEARATDTSGNIRWSSRTAFLVL